MRENAGYTGRVPSASAGTDLTRYHGLRWATVMLTVMLMVLTGLLAGCSGAQRSTYENALSLDVEQSGVSSATSGSANVASEFDLYDRNRRELRDGPAVQHLGVARMLRNIGVMELLSSYIVNVPRGAFFLPNFELQAAMSASRIAHGDASAEARLLWDFEREMLSIVRSAELFWSPAPTEVDLLHKAFFEVFEQCGRDSPWPDAKMADREGNSASDVLYLEPDWSILLYEYRELLHVCGRYAATYPTLEPDIRDELLVAQRTYFAQEIINRLNDDRWPLEVPQKYQAEIEDLHMNGW